VSWLRDLLFNSGIPQYLQKGKSYKLPEVVNGDDGNLRAQPPSWFRGRAHSGRKRRRGFQGFAPPPLQTEHLHTCQSILLAILLKNVLKMLKNHSACNIFTHSLILPSTSLRPVAEIWYRVRCNRVTCFSDDRDN